MSMNRVCTPEFSQEEMELVKDALQFYEDRYQYLDVAASPKEQDEWDVLCRLNARLKGKGPDAGQ